MEELVLRLIGESRIQQAVAMNTLDNGLHIFAYPLHDGVLVAMGLGHDAPLSPGDVLRRRGGDLARLGGWLPSLFNDGSIYLVRRLTSEEEEGGEPLAQQLALAQELLN